MQTLIQTMTDFLQIFKLLSLYAIGIILICIISAYIVNRATKPSNYKKVYKATNGYRTLIPIDEYKTKLRQAKRTA